MDGRGTTVWTPLAGPTGPCGCRPHQGLPAPGLPALAPRPVSLFPNEPRLPPTPLASPQAQSPLPPPGFWEQLPLPPPSHTCAKVTSNIRSHPKGPLWVCVSPTSWGIPQRGHLSLPLVLPLLEHPPGPGPAPSPLLPSHQGSPPLPGPSRATWFYDSWAASQH